MPRNLDYKADLLADLRADSEFATEYLSAAYADSQEAFLVALRDVAEARKGIAKVAVGAKVNRENLYRMLSKEGNPRLSTLGSVLSVLGMDLTVKLKEQANRFEPDDRPESQLTTLAGGTNADPSPNRGGINSSFTITSGYFNQASNVAAQTITNNFKNEDIATAAAMPTALVGKLALQRQEAGEGTNYGRSEAA